MQRGYFYITLPKFVFRQRAGKIITLTQLTAQLLQNLELLFIFNALSQSQRIAKFTAHRNRRLKQNLRFRIVYDTVRKTFVKLYRIKMHL